MEKKSLRDLHFLVAGGHDSMRQSIISMLKLIGFGDEIIEAESGNEAWKHLGRGLSDIDFIISAADMEEGDGVELLQRVRNDKIVRDIVFLLVSSEISLELVAEAAEYDVDGCLAIPCSPDSLERKIESLWHKAWNPDPMTMHLRLAREQEERGNLVGAIDQTQLAIAANLESSRPLREQGRLYLKLDSPDQALASFQGAVSLNQLDVGAHHNLGMIHFNRGQVNRAMVHFGRAMAISPRDAQRSYYYGCILLQRQQKDEARDVLASLYRNHQENIELMTRVGVVAEENGLNDLAIKCFRHVLERKPNELLIHKKLGILLQEEGNSLEAVTHLETAAVKYGRELDLLLAMARACLVMDRFEQAHVWADRAKDLFPTETEVRKILLQCR